MTSGFCLHALSVKNLALLAWPLRDDEIIHPFFDSATLTWLLVYLCIVRYIEYSDILKLQSSCPRFRRL